MRSSGSVHLVESYRKAAGAFFFSIHTYQLSDCPASLWRRHSETTRYTSLGFVGNATADLPSKMSDDIKSGHHGPKAKVWACKIPHLLCIFFRSAHEICAGRVPSAPVSMLVSRLANALPCSMGWAQ